MAPGDRCRNLQKGNSANEGGCETLKRRLRVQPKPGPKMTKHETMVPCFADTFPASFPVEN
jgi:hypothetical protein